MSDKKIEITAEDFRAIREQAITLYNDSAFPVRLKRSNKTEVQLDSREFASYFIVQSTLNFLKSKNLI